MAVGTGPQRTCIGCRRTTDAGLLRRLARSPEGTVVVGPTLEGRGAWICSGSRSCFDLAVKRDAFRRVFRAPVDRSAVERLRCELFGGEANDTDFVPGHQPARDY